MDLLIGTTSGLFKHDRSEVITGTRINHVTRFDGSWWAADGKSRIHRDGEVVGSLPDRAAALCVQPTPETTWIGSTEARLYGLDLGNIAEDEFFADAPGRETWYTPWGGPPDVRSMTLDAGNTLYINVHVGGVHRYDNTGLSSVVDVDADVHQIAAHPNDAGSLFAATAIGLAGTHNGREFEFRTEGLHATYCRAVAVLPGRVLVSASTGPSTSRGRLYTADLHDGELRPLGNGLPDWFGENLNTACIAVLEGDVYVGVDDTIWSSADSGESWKETASGLPRISCLG